MLVDVETPIEIPLPLRGKPLRQWTPAEVMTFVKMNIGQFFNPKDLELVQALELPGITFLKVTVDFLKQEKIPGTVALALVGLVDSLKAPPVAASTAEKRAGDPLESLTDEEKIRRRKLEIVVDNPKKPTIYDLIRTNIKVKPALDDGCKFLTSSPAEWPEHVREFHDKLIAPVTYPPVSQDPEIQAVVGILKRRLGDEAFDEQFQSGTTGVTADELSTYYTAVTRLDRGLNYDAEWTALTKEINLAALVVDPAIQHLRVVYNRDKSRTTILIAGQYEPWCPRSDFSVAYGFGDNAYMLFHGETDSGGTEEDAMFKNALLSCHSWKLFNHLTSETRHVILSAYVSNDISSMYMFYKSEEGFVMECILKISSMFDSKRHVIQFLRRVHQFAANIQWGSKYQGMKVDYGISRLYARKRPTKSGPTKTKSGSTARTAPKSSGANAPSNAIQYTDLADTGFTCHEIFKHGHIATVRDVDSGGKWIAKKIWDQHELRIIKFLLAAKSMNFPNHTIILKAEFTLENDRALLIMPQHVDLSLLTRLDQSVYNDLRSQLIEGVAFMHEQGVAHRDLKPSNLVIESMTKPHGKLFIIDYGLAKQYAVGDVCAGYRGTKGWTAPEVQDWAEWYPMPADVWSMAQVIVGLAKSAECDYSDMVTALSDEPSLRPTAAQLLTQISLPLPPNPSRTPVATKGHLRPSLKRRFSKLL